jgi:hypothetical protein
MSRASTKAAGRTSKATAGNRKKAAKSAKSARKAVKKPIASASRRSAAKPARRAAAVKHSVAAKPQKAVEKVAEPTTATVAAFLVETAVLRTHSPPAQPAPSEIAVQTHKYRIGETVYYTSPSFGRAAASGSYTVVKLLPSDGEDYQYRIKSSDEAFERVAKESQLDRA